MQTGSAAAGAGMNDHVAAHRACRVVERLVRWIKPRPLGQGRHAPAGRRGPGAGLGPAADGTAGVGTGQADTALASALGKPALYADMLAALSRPNHPLLPRLMRRLQLKTRGWQNGLPTRSNP
jgi:hypothetical protein